MMDIITTGVSKSGKTSIRKVVFDKRYPNETVFNEPTNKAENLQVESLGYSYLNLTEFPSSFSFNNIIEYDKYLSTCQVLIFIIDTQIAINPQYEYFKSIIPLFNKYNSLSLCVFFHKIDNLDIAQTDYNEERAQLKSKIKQIIKGAKLDYLDINFYATSIYNSSLFEAFSQIFQNILPQNKNLSSLIDNLSINCGFEKAFLFDVYNKFYLAVDSSPNKAQHYEICTDIIDLALDVSGIYGDQKEDEEIDSFFDENSICSIKLNSKVNNDSKDILFLKFIHKNLALVAIINEDNYERNNLLEYNINIFRQGVKNILKFK